MASGGSQANRSIRDFFIPKARRPNGDDVGEEIVVASSRNATVASPWPVQSIGSQSPPLPAKARPVIAVTASQGSRTASSPSSPPALVAERAPIKAANTSFSSTSSLSSLPLSSQTSSKRVIKNGLNAVTNSDSDTDDASTDELADVSTFFVNKRRKLSPPSERSDTPPSARTGNRLSSRLVRQDSRRSSLPNAPASPPTKVYRHSLAKLVAQNQKWKNTEEKIAALESSIADAVKREEEVLASPERVNTATVVATAESDSDERDRMLQALSRVEAFQHEESFHVFRDSKPIHGNSPFPEASLDSEIWRRGLADEQTRSHACVAGFVADLAARHPLPSAVMRWMATQLSYEPSDALCESYVQILKTSIAHRDTPCDDLATLSFFYQAPCHVEDGQHVQLRTGLPPGLAYIIPLVSSLAPAADRRSNAEPPTHSTRAFVDLALMGLDDSICDEPSLSRAVAKSIEDMLDELSDEAYRRLTLDVLSQLFQGSTISPRLRCRLIINLPAGTLRSFGVRRRLALQCFCAASLPIRYDRPWTYVIVDALATFPEFTTGRSTDYDLMLALISVLDIAIAHGFIDSPEFDLLSQAKPDDPMDQLVKRVASQGIHDHRIDVIASRLRSIGSRIRDVGTTHLRRIQAKSAIDRLVARLECSVRTMPKPKKGVFDKLARRSTGRGGR